jgi:RNA recognition motif-containing protein
LEEYRNGIDTIFENLKEELSEDEAEDEASGHALRTLYIKNLNEKVSLRDLKECLYVLGQRFGQVLDVKAKKNVVMRGQSFIVFKKKQHAKAAKEGLNGFTIFGKQMEVQWAKRDSDFVISKDKRSYKIGKSRLVTKDYFHSEKFKQRMHKKLNEQQSTMINNSLPVNSQNITTMNDNSNDSLNKVIANTNLMYQEKQLNQINNTLLLDKLPDISTDVLIQIFSVFEGYKGVRHIRPRRVSFVDFDVNTQASSALAQTKDHIFEDGTKISINFAKK